MKRFPGSPTRTDLTASEGKARAPSGAASGHPQAPDPHAAAAAAAAPSITIPGFPPLPPPTQTTSGGPGSAGDAAFPTRLWDWANDRRFSRPRPPCDRLVLVRVPSIPLSPPQIRNTLGAGVFDATITIKNV